MTLAGDHVESVRTHCRMCPAGCGMIADVVNGVIVRVRGDKLHPMSHGYLCPKGLAAADAHNSPHRLNRPLVRSGAGLSAAGFFDTGSAFASPFIEMLGTTSFYTATSVDSPGYQLVAERKSDHLSWA